jgi:hypothetical protein
MINLTDLIPANYQSEKKRFLADPSFNPQFIYTQLFTEEELLTNGLPSTEYLTLAQQILDATYEHFTPKQLQTERGNILDQETVSKAIKDFLTAHGLQDRFSIVWSADFISRTTVTPTEVRLRLPSAIYEDDLRGLLYHELGTHVLRRINYEQQPWYKKRKQFGFGPFIRTEEGLASLNALHAQTNLLAFRPALNYLAVQKAQTSSFLEVWQFVKQYTENNESAFAITFKKKRGVADTSQPGGFTKDLVYFEGLIEVTRFLVKNNFPVKKLYFGKLAWQDVSLAIELNPNFQPLLPKFYTDDPGAYEQRIQAVAQANFI